MNLIKHVWKYIKAILKLKYPHLSSLSDNVANRAMVIAALKAVWWVVPQAMIDRLVESMPRRVAALRWAKGWYIKY